MKQQLPTFPPCSHRLFMLKIGTIYFYPPLLIVPLLTSNSCTGGYMAPRGKTVCKFSLCAMTHFERFNDIKEKMLSSASHQSGCTVKAPRACFCTEDFYFCTLIHHFYQLYILFFRKSLLKLIFIGLGQVDKCFLYVTWHMF